MIRVSIKEFMGRNKEIVFDSMPNIREFEVKIGREYGWKWNEMKIMNIFALNRSGERIKLGSIYHDDAGEQNLDDFIKAQGHLDVSLDNITVYIMQRIIGDFFRPTIFTPKDGAPACPAVKLKAYEDALATRSGETFKEQFAALGIPDDKIPEKFLDPITMIIMNKPVIASDGRTYDESTLERLDYISPYTKEKLINPPMPNMLLRAEMTIFISGEIESRSHSVAGAGAK
jgi:hypothetical protein